VDRPGNDKTIFYIGPSRSNVAVLAIITNPGGTPSLVHSELLICSAWAG
jgi:hypothetical protein